MMENLINETTNTGKQAVIAEKPNAVSPDMYNTRYSMSFNMDSATGFHK